MIIGASIISVSTITTPLTIALAYDSIKLYEDGGYDNVVLLNKGMTATEIAAYFAVAVDYSWTLDTRLYAEFISNLLGGNISISNIANYILYRQNVGIGVTELISNTIDADATTVTDYTAILGNIYRYQLSAISSTGETSNGIWSAQETSDYFGWYLIDSVDDVVFKFDIDVQTSGLSVVTGNTFFTPVHAEKGLVNKPSLNFTKGTINCKLGYMDSSDTFIDNTEYMDTLISVIKNGNKKYLKDRKGRVWQIEVVGDMKFSYLDNVMTQPTGVSFDFIEVREDT